MRTKRGPAPRGGPALVPDGVASYVGGVKRWMAFM